MHVSLLVCAAWLAPTLPQSDAAPPADPAVKLFELVDAFPGQKAFRRPLYLDRVAADPGHDYVVEQFGSVFRVPRDGSKADRHLFLDWTHKTLHPANGGHNEEGLLGFAFDPAYAENRFVYIYYSHRPERGKQRSVVSRLTVRDGEEGPTADRDTELELLVVPQPFANHNGGTILFGPDGMLYVALGDGGAANDPFGHGQNLETLLGSILRIDVRGATAEKPYAIPADNPFADKGEEARGEIWAYGLRNPWRISFDRQTGDLWCGDVGQDTWEEVDRIVKGGNYGWNHREAHVAFTKRRQPKDEQPLANAIEPIAYYPRPDGYSITGGYVYRGKRFPELQGCFIYADFVTGHVWSVKEDRTGGKHEVQRIAEAGNKQVASFGELADGELVLLCYDGRIYGLK